MIELVMESLMYYLASPRKQRCHPELWLSTAICRTTVEWALALLSSVSMSKFMTVQSTTYPLGSKVSLSKGLGTPIFPLKKPGDIKTYFWDVRRRMYSRHDWETRRAESIVMSQPRQITHVLHWYMLPKCVESKRHIQYKSTIHHVIIHIILPTWIRHIILVQSCFTWDQYARMPKQAQNRGLHRSPFWGHLSPQLGMTEGLLAVKHTNVWRNGGR